MCIHLTWARPLTRGISAASDMLHTAAMKESMTALLMIAKYENLSKTPKLNCFILSFPNYISPKGICLKRFQKGN